MNRLLEELTPQRVSQFELIWDMTELRIWTEKLNALVAVSTAYPQTPQLRLLSRTRNGLCSYLLGRIRLERWSYKKENREIYRDLAPLLQAYRGMHRLKSMQTSGALKALVADCQKPREWAALQTLGLTDVVERLDQANDAYEALVRQRIKTPYRQGAERSATVRKALASLLNIVLTRIEAVHLLHPDNQEAADFLAYYYNMSEQMSTLIKQRKALRVVRKGQQSTATKKQPKTKTTAPPAEAMPKA